MIEERNLSGLVTYLSTEHPIVQILKENTQQQLNVLEHYIPNDHPALVELKIWERWLTNPDKLRSSIIDSMSGVCNDLSSKASSN
jgi:hypothetical protein